MQIVAIARSSSGQIMISCVMPIDTIRKRNSPPAYFLRESVRQGRRPAKRTIANHSVLPIVQIEMIRRVLKGERLGAIESALEVTRSQARDLVDNGARQLGHVRRTQSDPLHTCRSSRRAAGRVQKSGTGDKAQHGSAMTAARKSAGN